MVKYPWEKDESEEESESESSEETAFPWLKDEAAEQSRVDLDATLSPEEEAVLQTMVTDARRKPRGFNAQLPVLNYVNTEPEPIGWKLPLGILAGTACLGALAFFFANQHGASSPSVNRVATVKTTSTLPAAQTSAIPENSDVLIPPTDLNTIREQTSKGRSNPFKDTLPAPPPPPPPPPAPKAVAVKPVKPPPPPQPIFSGISVAVSGNDRVAIVQVSGLDPAPTVHEVMTGDQVAGWSVKSITTERAVLVKGNKTLNVPFL